MPEKITIDEITPLSDGYALGDDGELLDMDDVE